MKLPSCTEIQCGNERGSDLLLYVYVTLDLEVTFNNLGNEYCFKFLKGDTG